MQCCTECQLGFCGKTLSYAQFLLTCSPEELIGERSIVLNYHSKEKKATSCCVKLRQMQCLQVKKVTLKKFSESLLVILEMGFFEEYL